MIKLNTPYKLENGDHVIFTEGKKGTINGKHSEATLTGILEGNVLKATFHNTTVNATGLMEITFHENGFNAKWKSGLEPGPMRGKWNGIFNETERNFQKIEKMDFEVVLENGNQKVLSFSLSTLDIAPNLTMEHLNVDEYYNIIMNPLILKACYQYIVSKDKDFFNDADEYVLRLTGVNEENFSFLWDIEYKSNAIIDKINSFFKRSFDNLEDESLKSLIEEFVVDSVCSLSYVKAFN